jgi:hypothetical protein
MWLLLWNIGFVFLWTLKEKVFFARKNKTIFSEEKLIILFDEDCQHHSCRNIFYSILTVSVLFARNWKQLHKLK